MGKIHDGGVKSTFKHQLLNNEFFRNSTLTAEDFDELDLNLINLKKGEILYHAGDESNSVFLLMDGEINLIRKQPHGKIKTRLLVNQFFGHEEFSLQVKRNSIAEAISDSSVIELSKEDLEKLSSIDDSFLYIIKHSMLNLSPVTSNHFDNIRELPDYSDPNSLSFPLELSVNNEKQVNTVLIKENNRQETKMSANNKSCLNISASGISSIIKSINENLSLLEEENNNLVQLFTGMEDENKELKERNNYFISLDKEKNELLGNQSYRIKELEKENKELQKSNSEYYYKVQAFETEADKSRNRIAELEQKLKNAEAVNVKMDDNLKSSLKIISDLRETNSVISKKVDNQEKIFNELRLNLNESKKEVENLTQDLSEKEENLTKVNKELDHLNKQLLLENDNLKNARAEISSLEKNVIQKDEAIKNLSVKLENLQNRLISQQENEKKKNEFIINQSHKINEGEELIKYYKKQVNEKDVLINKFVSDFGEFSENIWHKQNEVNEQKSISAALSNEIKLLKSQIHTIKDEMAVSSDEFNEKIQHAEAVNKERLNEIKKYEQLLNHLQKEASQKDEIINKYTKDIGGLAENIWQKQFEIDEQNLVIKELNEQAEALKKFEAEAVFAVKEKAILEEAKNKEINELNTQLAVALKTLGETKKNWESGNKKIAELENTLSKMKAEQSGNSGSNELNEELNLIKSELKKYQDDSAETDKIRNRYEQELKKKDIQIDDLKNKLEEMKQNLDVKTFLEEHQTEEIENQAKKIAELEIIINENKSVPKNQETVMDTNPSFIESEEITSPDEDEEILSKSRLINSAAANKFSDDNSIEHLNYSGIEIINLNLPRATMDMAMNFNNFLNEVINKNNIKVVVNLAYCDYIDSSFLGALVNGVKKARKHEGDLKIVYHNLNEYSMFSLTKMDNIFQIYKSLKEAVDSYSE